MNNIFSKLIENVSLTGDIPKDVNGLLSFHGKSEIAVHTRNVANNALKLAQIFNADKYGSFISGCLHDISRIIPNEKMVGVCNELGIEVLNEELTFPSLLHPRLSKQMAQDIFNIKDFNILSAIECHTTLKANPGVIDMILFVADKMSWDKGYSEPFINEVTAGLDKSLEMGSYAYLKYMFERDKSVKVFHPMAIEAYNELKVKLG